MRGKKKPNKCLHMVLKAEKTEQMRSNLSSK